MPDTLKKKLSILTSTSACICSYREESDNQTDSDDLVEMEEPIEKEENNAETIERVVRSRFGRKGGKKAALPSSYQ